MKTLRSILTAVLLSVVALQGRAIPAWPGLHRVQQPDGTVLTCRLMGDEHCHSFVTTDGYLIGRDAAGAMRYVTAVDADGQAVLSATMAHDAALRTAEEKAVLQSNGLTGFARFYREQTARRAPRRVLDAGSFPTKGEVRGLVLLVEFKDNAFQPQYDQALYERQLNEEGYADYGATGSARDYFISQSMGQFTPRFDVVGPIKLSRVMTFYGASSQMQNDANPGEMVREACQIAHDSLGVDFSQYDYNDDGDVDFVFILYAGYGENYGASSSTIWPHMSTLRQLSVACQFDGKTIDRYACSCELNGSTGTELDGIGAVCHEFGHVLGLPDFYNTFNPSQTQLGSWDVMDAASYNNNSRTPASYTAFERYSLGWMELTELDAPADSIVVSEITQNNVGYRISTQNPNEFFTLENHQQVGWDRYQGGRGLMVIHVNYDASAWNNNLVNSGFTPRYDLVEADGTQGYDLATDLYPTPSNDLFTDYSSPSSMSWAGVPTEKGVTRICQNDDGTVSFRYMKDRLARPVVLSPTNVTGHSAQLNWEPVEGAVAYSLSLRELLPDSLNPIILDEDFSLMTAADYPKSATQALGDDLNDYFHQTGWQGSDVYASNGCVRIGSYGKSGYLATPRLHATADSLTLAWRAVSYPGKKVGYTVTLTDDATGEVLATEDLKADKNETLLLRHLPTGTSATFRLRFSTANERLFLSHMRLLDGQADSTGVWTAGPREWTVDSIEATSYVVDGLDSCRTYAYTVMALATGGLTASLPSAEQQFVTIPTELLSVGSSVRPARCLVATEWFDVSGRRVSSAMRGLLIRRRLYSDGTADYDKVSLKDEK